jgi:hypothetical protein
MENRWDMRFQRVFPTLALACLLLGGTPGPGSAQGTPDSPPHPGDPLKVYLMTIGQGDIVWEQFSHNAIWIQNEDTGQGRAYNWGVFDFDQDDFVPRLIRGTMLYKIDTFDPRRGIQASEQTDRAVWVQELDLTPTQRFDLYSFVEWNARPENRDYRYDYYRDNCSTRVRDALDIVLDGRIRASSEDEVTTHTYRWHTRRLLQGMPGYYLGIQLVLGASADRPLTAWEEFFLPIKLMEQVREIEVPDGEGGMKPLVVEERQLLGTTRPPIPTETPFALPLFFLAGLLWGGSILLLSRRGPTLGVMGRLGLTVLAGSWSLVAVVCGVLLLGAWAYTDHVFWYRNLNLLQLNPLFLPLLFAYLAFLFKGSFPRWGRDLAAALALVAGMGLAMRFFPGLGQVNGEILALTVPVNLSLALGATWLLKQPDPPEAGEGS